jgi:hypothetical protein
VSSLGLQPILRFSDRLVLNGGRVGLSKYREHLICGTNAAVGWAFHEPLPVVEEIGVLAGEKDVADGRRLVAEDSRKVARLLQV